MQLHTHLLSNHLINPVPGKILIPGHLHGLTDGQRVSHQAGKALRHVTAVRDGPERGSVPVDQNRFSRLHAAKHLVTSVVPMHTHRNLAVVIGMAGADHCHREAVFTVFLPQQLLALNLVAGILPKRIGKRRLLRDRKVFAGLLIGRGRADEHKLPAAAGKQPDIPLGLRGGKADKVADTVKALPGQLFFHFLFHS